MIAIEKQNYEIKAKYQSDLNITLSKQVQDFQRLEPEMRKHLTTAEQRYDYKVKELDDEK